MSGFLFLHRAAVEAALAAAFRRWDASPAEAEAFRTWAWGVAAVADTYASEDPPGCAALLRDEMNALHRIIAERLLYVAGISEELVARREFLGALAAQARPEEFLPVPLKPAAAA